MRNGKVRFNTENGKEIEVIAAPDLVILTSYKDGLIVSRWRIERAEACAIAEAFEFLGVRPSYIERAYERCGGEPKADGG